MDDMKLEIEGLKELNAALKLLPQEIQGKTLQNAVRAAMRPAFNAVKGAAPIDKEGQSWASKKYGELHKNIKLRKAKSAPNGKGVAITTGNAFWGYFLEKGTRYIPASHWFTNAFNPYVTSIFNDLGEDLGKAIERAWKRLNKT